MALGSSRGGGVDSGDAQKRWGVRKRSPEGPPLYSRALGGGLPLDCPWASAAGDGLLTAYVGRFAITAKQVREAR